MALAQLKEENIQPQKILDMGTGSGILALAAHKLWNMPTIGIDNDPESIIVSNRHADFNNIQLGPGTVQFACGDGFAANLCRQETPYDLISANILAGPLKTMAKDLASCLTNDGTVILSGILREQADDVLKTYEAQNLTLKHRIDIDDWATLVLKM